MQFLQNINEYSFVRFRILEKKNLFYVTWMLILDPSNPAEFYVIDLNGQISKIEIKSGKLN
jgi:hypothetical protein